MDTLCLVKRCINRDPLAWNVFVQQYSGLIFWAIRDKLNSASYTYNQQDIEDIFQNVFLLLWEKEKLRQIINKQDICTWLVMVAANCARNHFRGQKLKLQPRQPLIEQLVAFDCGVNQTLEQEQVSQIIKEILSYLRPKESIALKLNYLYRRTHQQIGQLLNLPPNTVSSIIKRTKDKLKEELKAQGWNNF